MAAMTCPADPHARTWYHWVVDLEMMQVACIHIYIVNIQYMIPKSGPKLVLTQATSSSNQVPSLEEQNEVPTKLTLRENTVRKVYKENNTNSSTTNVDS